MSPADNLIFEDVPDDTPLRYIKKKKRFYDGTLEQSWNLTINKYNPLFSIIQKVAQNVKPLTSITLPKKS